MRNLIAKVQIKNVSEDVEVEDAEHYVQVLEDHLVAGPENEMRRNWFNSVIPAGMRVEDTRRVEAQLSPWEAVTVPPQPTARVDDGSKLFQVPKRALARGNCHAKRPDSRTRGVRDSTNSKPVRNTTHNAPNLSTTSQSKTLVHPDNF